MRCKNLWSLESLAARGLLYPDMHHATTSPGQPSEQTAIRREHGAAECSRVDVSGFRRRVLLRQFRLAAHS
jgi:hypothetical protein